MGKMTYEKPPIVSTEETPLEIVGHENMNHIKRHLASGNRETGEYAALSPVYAKLRDNGFYPLGIEDNKVKWGVALKSDAQMLVDSTYPEFDEIDWKNMSSDDARELCSKIAGKYITAKGLVKDMPRLKSGDIARERGV